MPSPDVERELPLTPATLHVLLSLADGGKHGYAIIQEVSERTSGEVQLGAGTLYALVKRLLAGGLVDESDDRPDPSQDDERRRYYRLTPFGRDVAIGGGAQARRRRASGTRGAAVRARGRAKDIVTDRPRSNRRFRVLAALFPGPVREAHGRELQQVWQAQHRAAGAATRARARFWFGAIADVLRGAPLQHVEEFRHDLRYALRALRRTPGFATAAVLTLALGIGATSAVFMVIDAVLLRPLPYRDPSSVALVWAVGKTGERTWLSWPEFDDIARRSTRLEGIAGLTDLRMVLTGNGAPQELQALGVSASLFPLLGVHAQLGRLFDVRDDCDGAGRAVLLSDGFWRSRFGAQSSVLGSAVILDGQAYTMPACSRRHSASLSQARCFLDGWTSG